MSGRQTASPLNGSEGGRNGVNVSEMLLTLPLTRVRLLTVVVGVFFFFFSSPFLAFTGAIMRLLFQFRDDSECLSLSGAEPLNLEGTLGRRFEIYQCKSRC